MCSCYNIDDGTAREIEILIRQTEETLHQNTAAALRQICSTDIHPADKAPVLAAGNDGICCIWLRWGFPMQPGLGKGLVFNARCESAAEKNLFREGIRHRRIVVPATAFYEWNRQKTKYVFEKDGRKALFMAGCCRHYGDDERFVILTTAANSSMRPVHDRMPLLLDEAEVREWILDSERTDSFLRKTPCLLNRSTDYEQLSFF